MGQRGSKGSDFDLLTFLSRSAQMATAEYALISFHIFADSMVCTCSDYGEQTTLPRFKRLLACGSVHLTNIPSSELRIVLTILIGGGSLATTARIRSRALPSQPALRAASMVN